MSQVRFLSYAEQAARHLREELVRGRWSGTMPGTPALAQELGINSKTVTEALDMLGHEGLLEAQGPGRRRLITLPEDLATPALRVGILPYSRDALKRDYMVEIEHKLPAAGHHLFRLEKGLYELGMKPARIRRAIEAHEADAWVVVAGSREVLEWFSARPTPVFALFGRMAGLPLAGVKPDKGPALAATARRLVALGHRRIALLVHPERRIPEPGGPERLFLDELESLGVATSGYHLPDWEWSEDGFHRCLEQLFRSTPPSALVVEFAQGFIAAQQFLGNRGLRVPQDVSLVCGDVDSNFSWLRPTAAHIRWDHRPVARRLVRWTNNIARGKDDRRQTLIKAELIEGGTVGRAR